MTGHGFEPSTPVAFIMFNRPDIAARVFEAIREAYDYNSLSPVLIR